MNELDMELVKALSPLYESVKSWIIDQEDGTSFIGESLKLLDDNSEKVITDIKQIYKDYIDKEKIFDAILKNYDVDWGLNHIEMLKELNLPSIKEIQSTKENK